MKHFSELASEDEYRRGIGFSRLADTLQNTLKVLEKPVMDKLLQPGPLKKARETAKTLLPQCAVLNAGTHNLRENPSNKRRKVQGDDKPRPTYEAIHDACTALLNWLKDPKDDLRTFMALMSQGGAFFSFQVMEKSARAFANFSHHNTIEHAKAAAQSRLLGGAKPPDAGSAASSRTQGDTDEASLFG